MGIIIPMERIVKKLRNGEFISREAAIKSFCDGCIDEEDCHASPHKYVCAEVEAIKALPAADVRPVVFCRDCDCWNEWDSAGRESLGNYVCSCAHWSVEDGATLYTRPTDFCSYGEKREES